jgi:mannose-6-phosphate isomerase-like protein (cupin superfamily)
MDYVRPIDWAHAQIQREGDYRGQILYTGESCVVIATKVPPHVDGPPRHRHPSDQTYFVLQGQLNIELGREVKAAAPHSVVFIPAGLPHHNWNEGDEDEVHLEVIAPGVLPIQALASPTESPDSTGPSGFVREPDPGKLTGQGFALDWLVNRELGAHHAALYLAEVPPAATTPPMHVHEFDQFYFVVEGKLSVEVGLDRFDAEPNTLVVLPAGVPHRQWNEQGTPERHLTVLAPEPALPHSASHPWDVAVELTVTGQHIG